MSLESALTRRRLIGGIGAAGVASAVGIGSASAAQADRDGPTDGPDAGPSVQRSFSERDLANPITQTLSAYDFRPIEGGGTIAYTYVFPGGVHVTGGSTWFVAGLRLPAGAIITGAKAYLNPNGAVRDVDIARYRPLPAPPVKESLILPLPTSTAGTAVEALTLPLTHEVDPAWNYILLSPLLGVGGAIFYGAEVTYTIPTDPTGHFVPFAGANPRVYDSRTGAGKLAGGAERVIPLGVPGTVKAAVFNITVTETKTAGFVACFKADIAWPGNSSVNWYESGANTANLVICAVDATGSIRIRGGNDDTHVVIDLIGTFV